MNPSGAFPVTDPSEVAAPRRAVLWLARHLNFSDERAGQAALIASELATNLAKHARGGELLMRPLWSPEGDADGLEVMAVDKGPGIADVALSHRDGYSTSGTLGHGLGAVRRQADWTDLYTHTSGTVIAARLWREPHPRALGWQERYEIGAVHVAKSGEAVCGDGWSWRMRAGRLSIVVADGLGHGLAAHEAARAALDVYAKRHEESPVRLLEDVHGALRATRGAAVAILAVDIERGVAHYAGLGNISGSILRAAGGRQNLVSHNGTAGHTAGRFQEFAYPVPPDSILVMYSDGLTSHWDLAPYQGLRGRSASVIAGVLYRDFSRRRDDVTVVVAKERPAVAEKL
jgi:anti-sigma regulatory factor (Ser/Thr protein kinase)